MTIEEGFLKDINRRFRNYKDLGDKTLEQLNNEDMVFRPDAESNNIAIIVQHLHGNMMSRFTNFLLEDGEKPWRRRDEEFEDLTATKAATLALWNEGWACVFSALQCLQPADLMKTIYIRTEPLLVYDALLRQLAHCPYHVGQIVYIAKTRKGAAWQSLSIAKGQSDDYNKKMAAPTHLSKQ